MKFECYHCKELFEEPPSGILLHRKVKKQTQWFCSMLCKTRAAPMHKFGATRCESDSIKFSSKAERSYYLKLKELVKQGVVSFFLRQTPIALPGNTKYVVDFQVFYCSGEVEFVDVKGMITPLFIMKKKQVEELYPIEIKVVK